MEVSVTGLEFGLLGPPGEMELSLSVPVIQAHGLDHGLDPSPVQMAEILVDGRVHLVEIQAADVVMDETIAMEETEESDYSIVHLDSNANELDLASLKKINENNDSVTLWQVGLDFNYRKTVKLLPGAAPARPWEW